MTKRRRRNFSPEEIEIIKEMYPDHTTQSIADRLGRESMSSIYKVATRFKLYKSEAFKQSELSGRIVKGSEIGARYRFPKGNVPATFGKKQHEYMSPEAIANSKQHRYKKGNLPKNTKYDGAISVRKNSKGIPYKFIRIGKRNWLHLHVYLWRQANGEIPKNSMIIFKDGNQMNCTIENLQMITKKENMRRNTIIQYPPELQKTIKVLNKLKKRIHGKEQNHRPERSSIRNDRSASGS